MNIVYFGSFQHYSAIILNALIAEPEINVQAVVTTPPVPLGRKKILTKNPVHQVAENHSIPVFTPDSLGQPQGIAPTKPDYFLTAGYGKFLPKNWLEYPTNGSLNLHFSQLPKFRGANPAEWAILLDEKETGITLIRMNEKLDGGDILAQSAIPIAAHDTRDTLYEKLYILGAEKLPQWLLNLPEARSVQPEASPVPFARRFTRDEAFIDWRILEAAMQGKPFDATLLPKLLTIAWEYGQTQACLPARQGSAPTDFIDRAVRALAGFPGVWTLVNTTKGEKRLKILNVKREAQSVKLDTVQLEGYTPTSLKAIKNQLIWQKKQS